MKKSCIRCENCLFCTLKVFFNMISLRFIYFLQTLCSYLISYIYLMQNFLVWFIFSIYVAPVYHGQNLPVFVPKRNRNWPITQLSLHSQQAARVGWPIRRGVYGYKYTSGALVSFRALNAADPDSRWNEGTISQWRKADSSGGPSWGRLFKP